MVLLYRKTLISQIRFLAAALAAAMLVCYLSGWEPLLRAGPGMLLRGMALGIAVWFFAAAVQLILLRWVSSYRQEFSMALQAVEARSALATAGSAIAVSCGEEVFLRGAIFGAIALSGDYFADDRIGLTAAFLLNGLLTFSFYCFGIRPWEAVSGEGRGAAVRNRLQRIFTLRLHLPRYALIQVLIGTILAFAFYRSRALFLLLIARAVIDLLDSLLMRSKRAIKLINARAGQARSQRFSFSRS